MKRNALLIECSDSCYGDLPGASQDVENYRRYLLSAIGGAWTSSEIQTISNPSTKSLREAIAGLRSADYSLVTFSGHGYHVQGKDVSESKICLKDKGDEMFVYELNPGNDRCLLICDSCRNIHVIEETRASIMKFAAELTTNSIRSRQLFESAVGQAEKGLIRIFGCNLGESADESSAGGLFSKNLVETGNWWAAQPPASQGCLNAKDAFVYASAITKKRMPQQNPQYEPGRRIYHFPFAVYA